MKKPFCCAVCLMLCFVLTAPVFAGEAKREEDNTGDMTAEQGAVLWPVLTSEEAAIVAQRERQTMMMTRNVGQIHTIGVVPKIQQTNWWCGPATVQSAVAYKGGGRSGTKSQGTYAQRLGTTERSGTDFSKLPALLKAETGHPYVLIKIGTQNEWLNRIAVGITIKYPPCIDINASGVPKIPYTSPGHILPVSGYDRRAGVTPRVRVADVHNYCHGTRWYDAVEMYKANNNHWRKQMIY